MLNRSNFHDYQEAALHAMTVHKEHCIWLGLGDGKTVTALTRIKELGYKAIVFGTKRIIEYTWPTELEKWSHLEGLTYAAFVGSAKQREKAVLADPVILGVSYDNMKNYYENHQDDALFRLIAIFDEVSKMKDTSTQRFKAFKRSRSLHEFFYGLTATPAAENYLGLFGQYKAVVSEPILGKTLTQFRDTYTSQHFKGMYSEYRVSEPQRRAIEQAIKPFTFVVSNSTIAKRPEPTLEDVMIPWTGKNRDAYKQMEKKLVLELEDQRTPIQAASKGVAFNKCRQLACGFIYNEGQPSPFDRAKLDAIKEEYEALGGEPVLVAYQYIWEKEMLLQLLPGAEPLEGDAYQRFDRGEIPALVIHPKSCGHGLNLQGSCRHIFWSSLPWSLEDYLQTNGRIDRQGQTKQVVIKRFVRSGSIDEDILLRLAGKMNSMSELIARVKERE